MIEEAQGMSDNSPPFSFPLVSLPWVQLAAGLREKSYCTADRKFRLLEFGVEFQEPDWCTQGHQGYVLDGEIIVDVAGERVTFRSGDVIDLPAGSQHRHQRTVSTATLFLIEELPTAAPAVD